MIVAFRTVDARRQAVTDSSGAQLLVSYLVSDVQSADRVQPTDFQCDPGALLELRWTDADAALNRMIVATYTTSTDPAGTRLTRNEYTLSASATSCSGITPIQKSLVKDVDATATSARCDGGVTCSDSSVIVGLRVKAFSTQPKGNVYVPYTFDVSGTRRVK